jgi:uncharacterized Fe-S cluster-containing MiaB family protein
VTLLKTGKLSSSERLFSVFTSKPVIDDDLSDTYAVNQDGVIFYILCGACKEEIVDILICGNSANCCQKATKALSKYIVHLLNCDIQKARILFPVPNIELLALVLEFVTIKSIAVYNNNLVLYIYTGKNVYKENIISHKTKNELIEKAKSISRALRTAHFESSDKINGTRSKPLHGHPCDGIVAGSLGAFPEFILPTFPCKKTMQGFCFPCFFSKVEMSRASSDDIYNSFEIQTKYIIDNFDEQVMKCQLRSDQSTKALWDVTLCFASNGSLFSDSETTQEGRYHAFKMLYDEIKKRNLTSLVYIETCADDYLHFLDDSEESDKLMPILQKLNVVVLCGFESAQDFTRDVLYTKSLKLWDFEKVVKRNKEHGLQTGAFLYTGFHSMTQNEIIIDLVKSLCYLLKLDAVPVIMIPKLHDFTFPDLLYQYGNYNIIDPYTVLNIAEIVAWITNIIPVPSKKDKWMMSDLLDDIPISSTSFLNNKDKIVCMVCATKIRDVLQIVRSNMDYSLFKSAEDQVKNCENKCHERYLQYLNSEDHIRKEKSLIRRTIENTTFALEKKEQYIRSLCDTRKKRKQFISEVKKDLLCYGLSVDKNTLADIRKINKFFGESKFIHIAQIMLPGDLYVNAPVLEEFSKRSVYSLRVTKNNIILLKNSKELFEVTVSPLPSWTDKKLANGKFLSDIISIHGHNTLALVRHNECYYKRLDRGCKYCSGHTYCDDEDFKLPTITQIAEAVYQAEADCGNYSLALSGGTRVHPDRGAIYFSKIAKAVLCLVPSIKISVEIAPPESNNFIDMLINSGVNTLIMNMELFDDEKRRLFSPGKSEIPITRYFEALSYAVHKIGAGSVSSVLIAGLESIKSTIKGAKKLIDIGVIPTIMPFRPYDNCEMSDYPVTNPKDLLIIEAEINEYLKQKDLKYNYASGCLNCNACIGNDLIISYKKQS